MAYIDLRTVKKLKANYEFYGEIQKSFEFSFGDRRLTLKKFFSFATFDMTPFPPPLQYTLHFTQVCFWKDD